MFTPVVHILQSMERAPMSNIHHHDPDLEQDCLKFRPQKSVVPLSSHGTPTPAYSPELQVIWFCKTLTLFPTGEEGSFSKKTYSVSPLQSGPGPTPRVRLTVPYLWESSRFGHKVANF